ncbi:MAG: GNAT family N-acetyltransferase, partial [Bacteroidia bacterium]|nr:GNAT family N-acetyltransferase [Bacteroidia bacterium]
MLNIVAAKKPHQLQTIEDLANIIWNEHYTPIIGKAQVNYMLEKFQSVDAMKQQLEDGYKYYIIKYNEESIGYIAFKIESGNLFLSKIYILKTQRGKGFGKETMNFISNQASTHNCKT